MNKSQILEEIAAANNGQLSPEIVVETAKDKKHPLHPSFEWNNTKAGHMYRLTQAALLIRSCRVSVEVEGQAQPIKVRAWINVRDEAATPDDEPETGKYVPIMTALSIPTYKDQMIASAYRDLRAFQIKYRSLSELSKVLGAIDEILNQA